MTTWIGLFLLAAAASAPAGELCLFNSLHGRNLSVACGGVGYGNAWIGYSTSGIPCVNEIGTLCYDAPMWTVSVSPTDPFRNSGALPDPGELYLWFLCMEAAPQGLSAAEFDLLGTDLTVTGFTPMNGFVNAGTETRMLLAVGGCPIGPLVAGRIDVAAAVAVDATSWGGIKAAYR